MEKTMSENTENTEEQAPIIPNEYVSEVSIGGVYHFRPDSKIAKYGGFAPDVQFLVVDINKADDGTQTLSVYYDIKGTHFERTCPYRPDVMEFCVVSLPEGVPMPEIKRAK